MVKDRYENCITYLLYEKGIHYMRQTVDPSVVNVLDTEQDGKEGMRSRKGSTMYLLYNRFYVRNQTICSNGQNNTVMF